MVLFYVQALVMLPLCLITGVAAAAVGFTAWSMVVPIVYVYFDKPLYATLFISAAMDSAGGLFLTLVYGYRGKTYRPPHGLRWVPFVWCVIVMIAVAVTLSAFHVLLLKFSKLFEGGVGVVSFVIGVSFLVPGLLDLWRAHKRRQRMRALAAATKAIVTSSDAPYHPLDEEHSPPPQTSFFGRLLAVVAPGHFAHLAEDTSSAARTGQVEFSNLGAKAEPSDDLEQDPSTDDLEQDPPTDESAQAGKEEGEKPQTTEGSPAAKDDKDSKDGKDDCPVPAVSVPVSHSPVDEGHAHEMNQPTVMRICRRNKNAPVWLSHVLCAAELAGAAALSGPIGFGGGTFFALVLLLNTRNLDIIGATGSGCMLMCSGMTSFCITSAVWGLIDFRDVWLLLLTCITFQLMGTAIGAFALLKVPQAWIKSIVGIVVLLTGTVATLTFMVIG
eukprot:TRINITY_DN3272_c2_g1_i1.p1 TRINITY_DN3272_c2_g1~~TRINITY_DN3272_c2_g1_i1.p1  ORF type:complete len:442 (-),score=150.66 TRINITY_DN3272_c2_g1_i1:66-1391(-)